MAGAKKPKATKSVDDLVSHALKLAATDPKAKWLGKSAKALFDSNETNHAAAIAVCTDASNPLLTQAGAGGALTPAGQAIVAKASAAEQVAVTKAEAVKLPPTKRVEFLQGAIGRTPDAAAELTPLLERATAEKAAELRAETEQSARRAAAREANRAAYERALELLRQDHENEVAAAQQWWIALGQRPDALPAHPPAPKPQPEPKAERKASGGDKPEPRTDIDQNFRRDSADQFAAAWQAAWDSNRSEGLEFLEAAMWNIKGLKLGEAAGSEVAFDGKYHRCDAPAFTGDRVRIVRPGWTLEEGDDRDYVPLKALVERV